MKFIINGDKLKIEQAETINSGSFEDYLIPVEFDETWNDLTIEAIIVEGSSSQGISRAVINNEVYIDVSKKERYTIGFIGYTVENNQKVHQKTTDLKIIPMLKGAGEIEATNTEEIPTESEWEVYLAQVQEFINNGNEIINQANNLDLDITKNGRIATVTITKKDGTEKSVQISDGEKGDKGDDYVITQEDYQEIADIVENQINIPAKTSDLTNDSGFITNVDLSNYQTKIDSSHKLNSDLVDDTNQTNKFVTSTEKTTWNNKSNFSGSYNDLTDKPTIPNEITESTVAGWGFTKNVGTITEITMNGSSKGTSGAVDLGTVITSHQDISGKENISNKVTSLSTSSTDTQYPSAKCVYNLIGNIESLLSEV